MLSTSVKITSVALVVIFVFVGQRLTKSVFRGANVHTEENSISASVGFSVMPVPERTVRVVHPYVRVGTEPAPTIAGTAVLIADAESGAVYFEKGGNVGWPLASITKIMTAVVTLKNYALKDQATISVDSASESGASPYLAPGEKYSVHDLLRAVLVASDNVAAETLAAQRGRSRFIALMNEQAAEWGLTATIFYDPTGLSPRNRSTAANIAILAHRVYKEFPEIFLTAREVSTTVTEKTTGRSLSLPSTNEFTGRFGFLGGKTGFTADARGNLLSLFLYKDRPVAIVVLGTEDRFAESDTFYTWFTETYR